MTEPIIKLEGVSVIYNEGQGAREVVGLSDVSLEIYPREYIIFFGPSGCGKSTLMNVIGGIERIARGTITIAGKNLQELDDEEMSMYHRHQVGFIFQAYNLISTLTVLENIALPQFFDGISKGQWARSAYALAERFGIEAHVKKLPQELSGGQQQRVGVARSLVNNPAILLADEPTGNLDSKSARNVLDIFQELNVNENKTLLFVTHAPDYLSEADRIFYLQDGKIIDEVRNKQRKVAKLLEQQERGVKGAEEKADDEHVFPWKRFLKDAFVPPGIKSEKLTEFILGVPPEERRARIEGWIEKRLQGIVSKDELQKQLDVSYYRGGAGLDRRSAERIAKMVEHVLEHSQSIYTIGALQKEAAGAILNGLVLHIQEMIGTQFAYQQKEQLKQILLERFTNKIGPFEVKKRLDDSQKKGGMGLDRRTAVKLMRYIELVILVATRSSAVRGSEAELRRQEASNTSL